MYEELVKRLLSLSKIDAIQQEPGICRITMECIGAIKEIAIEAADAIEELQGTKCPHYIRNIHDRGDDSLCDKWMCEVKSLPKWIPVTDRLPEPGERVLVTNGGGFVCESFLAQNGNWQRGGVDMFFMTPAYWMQLPEPPKEETK